MRQKWRGLYFFACGMALHFVAFLRFHADFQAMGQQRAVAFILHGAYKAPAAMLGISLDFVKLKTCAFFTGRQNR
jgi:hypothetical protein